MRKLLTSMLTLTLVFGSLMTTPVMAEDTNAKTTENGNAEQQSKTTLHIKFVDRYGKLVEKKV